LANSVVKFSVDAQGNLQRNGYYDQGLLHKQSVAQDGQETIIYKDAFGRELAKVQNDNGKKWFTYTVYDGYGRVAMILPPEASDRLIPPNAVSADIIAKYAYRYIYDGFNRVITKYLPGCEAIEYVYDKGGRVIVTVDGEMNTLFTEYDVMGRSVRTSMVQLNTDLATLRRYPETVNSRVTVLKTLAEYRYDNADNRNLVFQANPIVSSNLLSPSDKGRLVYEKQYVLDDDTYLERNFFYDTHGRLIQTVERDASDYLHTYTTQYDFVGNVLKNSEEHKIGSKTDSKLTENTYDSYSRLLSSKTTVNNGTPATVRFTYNDLGQLENTTYGTSQTLTERYAYNIQGWKIQTASSKFSLNLHYFDAKYATPCHNGNIAEMDWLQSGQPLKTYAFTYDKLNRLTSSALYENNTLTSRYEEKSLTYDGQGNILTLIRTNENSVETTYNYTYNGNQLTTLTQNSTAYSYTYDDKGNMEHDGRKNLDFTYNVVNLPSVVKKNNTVVAQYRYLANGTKLSVKGADGKGYSYMGSMIYTNNNGVLALESTDFAGGRIYATNNTTEAHYHLSDHLGSPRVILNESMDILEQNDYYPFGMRHDNAAMMVSNNRFRYNGNEEQQIGGLDVLDYGARMYDAMLGRWHVVDPHAENYYPISPYAYVANNPIIRIDPDGRDIWELNNSGHVVNRIENTEIDQFVTIDNDGNRIEGNTYEYGTVTERKGHKDSRDRDITFFEVAGDDNATAIFEFFGDNYTTTSNMPVEWTHAKVGKDDSGRNIVGTIHEPDRTSVGHYLRTTGYTLREVNHNHPGGSDPSGIPRQPDGRPATGDIRGAELYQNKFPNVKLNVYRSRIAYPDKGGYHPYNRNSGFPGWRTNGN
jgi:RHS repeat-associated protein